MTEKTQGESTPRIFLRYEKTKKIYEMRTGVNGDVIAFGEDKATALLDSVKANPGYHKILSFMLTEAKKRSLEAKTSEQQWIEASADPVTPGQMMF